MSQSAIEIVRLDAEQAIQFLPDLVEILRDAVNNGASIGFIPPLDVPGAEAYWRQVIDAVKSSGRVLLIAHENKIIVGTVQLHLEPRANQKHRAEVMKLIVHGSHRRRGIGEMLMRAIEVEARKSNRSTLVLDTRQGDDAERLYLKLDWVAAGVIPRFAANADGSIDPTVIMYKLLE